MTWWNGLSVVDRLALAKAKTSRLIDHVSEVVRLHESNRILVYSDRVSKQIPVSYAAHAFNELQRAQHFFEIVRLCAIWDEGGEHRDSIPTVMSLLSDAAVLAEAERRIVESWGQDAHGFSQAQAQSTIREFENARKLAGFVERSKRLEALKNFRHKFIAHALTITTAEAKGGTITTPKYGHEGRLLRTSIRLVKTLYLAVSNTDFAFDMTVHQAKRNAEEFWGAMRFVAP